MPDSVAEVGLIENKPVLDKINVSRLIEPTSFSIEPYLPTQEMDVEAFISENKESLNRDPSTFLERDAVVRSIYSSPSQEIQKVRSQLARILLNSSHPREDYRRIEEVFVRNNLPYVAKVYKVFEILNPPQDLEKSNEYLSPVLNESTIRMKYYTIYRDLLKTNILSGNSSIREYVSILQRGEGIAQKAFDEGISALNEGEKIKLKHFLARLETLYENSLLGKDFKREPEIPESEFIPRIQKIREDMGVKEGQTINDRAAEMFLKPVGINNLAELKRVTKNAKRRATKRNAKSAFSLAKNGVFKIDSGDLIKGVNPSHLGYILNNGIMSSEFLGGDSSNLSAAPLNIDFSRMKEEDLSGKNDTDRFASVVNTSIARGYADVLIIIKNRGQFQETESGKEASLRPEKYELFNINSENSDGRHFGVRTGMPSSEIDCFIIQNPQDNESLNNLFLSIALQGIYIPVVDSKGKLIFSHKDYKQFRKFNAGLMPYEGDWLKVDTISESSPIRAKIEELIPQIKENISEVDELYRQIRDLVSSQLDKLGIELKDDLEFNWSILGAELLNIGSTARHTNVPGDYDFDLTVILDDRDFNKALDLKEKLLEALSPLVDKSQDKFFDTNGEKLKVSQIRAMQAQAFSKQPDIDIGIVRRGKERVVGSGQIIENKLDFIKKYWGEDVYYEVLANILLAKKVLKENHIYKQRTVTGGGDGGIGGIGVESWIISNNGNMITAFRSFSDAVHEGRKVLSLEEFKKRYRIINPGHNLRDKLYEDYTSKLDEESYKKMVQVIDDFLKNNSPNELSHAA